MHIIADADQFTTLLNFMHLGACTTLCSPRSGADSKSVLVMLIADIGVQPVR